MLVYVAEELNPATLAVIDWLNSSGATVELSTARALSANGLDVIHRAVPLTPPPVRCSKRNGCRGCGALRLLRS
jgi:hypothetical protein